MDLSKGKLAFKKKAVFFSLYCFSNKIKQIKYVYLSLSSLNKSEISGVQVVLLLVSLDSFCFPQWRKITTTQNKT